MTCIKGCSLLTVIFLVYFSKMLFLSDDEVAPPNMSSAECVQLLEECVVSSGRGGRMRNDAGGDQEGT